MGGLVRYFVPELFGPLHPRVFVRHDYIVVLGNHADAETAGAAFDTLNIPLVQMPVAVMRHRGHIDCVAVDDHSIRVHRTGDGLDAHVLWGISPRTTEALTRSLVPIGIPQ